MSPRGGKLPLPSDLLESRSPARSPRTAPAWRLCHQPATSLLNRPGHSGTFTYCCSAQLHHQHHQHGQSPQWGAGEDSTSPEVFQIAVIGGGVADRFEVALRACWSPWRESPASGTELVGPPNAPAAEGVYRLDRVGKGTDAHDLDRRPLHLERGAPAVESQLLRPRRVHVLHAAVSQRVPGRRCAPQPDPPRAAQRQGQRVRRLRQERRPDRTRARRTTHCSRWPAGPVPHTAKTGRVVARRPDGRIERLASGAPLLVDVEVGPQHRLYGLAQGDWPYEGQEGKEGFPAKPNTGHLMLANSHGQFKSVVSGLDRPTTVRNHRRHGVRGHDHRESLPHLRARPVNRRPLRIGTVPLSSRRSDWG